MKRVLFAVLLFTGSIVAAQQPPPSDFMNRVTAYGNVADFLEAAGRILTDVANRSVAESRIQQQLPHAHKALKWSGEVGYLFQTKAEVHTSTGIARVINGYPIGIGLGRTPAEALAIESENPLRSAGDAGFEPASDRSFYVWISRTGDQYEYRLIASPFNEALEAKALEIRSEQDLVNNTKVLQRDRVFEHMVTQAAQQTRNVETARKLAEINGQRRSAQLAVEDINARMHRALEQSARIEGAYRSMQAVAGILSVANLAAQASAMSDGELDKKLEGAKTSEEVLSISRTYQTAKDGELITIRQELTVKETEYRQKEDELSNELQSTGAPRIIIK